MKGCTLGVLFAACAAAPGWAAAPESSAAPPIVPPLVLPGTVEGASEARRLSFGRSGRIARIDVKAGDHVRSGQVVAALECVDAAADLAALEADWDLQQLLFQKRVRAADSSGLEVAKDRLTLAEADLRVAEAARTRLELVASETTLFSRQERDAAARRVAVARVDVSAAKEILDRLQNAISPEDQSEMAIRERSHKAKASRARYDISLCEIASPVAGIVAQTYKAPGEMTAAFDAALSVIENTDLRVAVCIPETTTDRVEVGQKLRIRLTAAPQKLVSAVIARIGPPQSELSANCAPCPLQVWLEPAEKISGVPLHSLAYVHFP